MKRPKYLSLIDRCIIEILEDDRPLSKCNLIRPDGSSTQTLADVDGLETYTDRYIEIFEDEE